MLRKEYLEKKSARMEDRTMQFADKWGTKQEKGLLSRRDMANKLHVTTGTIENYEHRLSGGELDQYMTRSAVGHVKFMPEAVRIMRDAMEVTKQQRHKKLDYMLTRNNKRGDTNGEMV